MRVLVLGFGSMGRRHARHARELGHVVHVHDRDGTRMEAAAAEGFALHAAGQAVRWDAVVVATPASSHAAALWASSCPRVLVEKPVALSLRDYWAHSRGVHPRSAVSVGYQLRFHPHARELRDWVRAQPTPPPYAAFHVASDLATWPGRDYADALLECSHELDLAQYVLGPLQAVLSAEASLSGQSWALQVRAGTTHATVHMSTEEPDYDRWSKVVSAAGGRMWWGWNGARDRSLLLREDHTQHALAGVADAMYRDELEAFLQDRREVLCTLDEALRVVRMCDEARRLAGRPAA